MSTTNPYRLPRTVTPHAYTLALEPDLAAASFTGHVVIDAIVNEPVSEIVLNAAELSFGAVRVDGVAAEFSADEQSQRLTIHHAHGGGGAVIEIDFTGTLNDKLRGWYRSTYTDAAGTEHVIATSQMQATDCRRAFPCFDEPDFKATFDITLIVEPGLLAVSNGPEVERTSEGGKDIVRFGRTMPMSTYLVAVVVGALEATEPVMVDRLGGGSIPLRIIHVPGKGHLTSFGLEAGAFALGWFQDYYGIPYPTDKCDMIALPDFAAGAMENLGCITFRETLLLADPAEATQAELQNLGDVISHELAHMWFGDLVTMRWWNGIWLNEAFATFMEVACCNAFRPDWKRWTSFSLERSAAFEVDSLAATRTVEFPVEAPQDCEGMFDVLTYEKGGSLLRMLEQYLGEDRFRAGVSHYLRTHEYGNTETGDLWDAIEEANPDTPVRRLMDSWIWQAGYPLVSAALQGDEVALSQQRFAFGDTDDATLFVIPLHVTVDGVSSKVLLDGDEVRIKLPSPDSVVIVNAGGHGFMRVAYDSALRSRILGGAAVDLSTVDRYNLVDDAWQEVVAGRLAAAEFVTFVEGFGAERDLAVWQAIVGGLRGVWRLGGAGADTALAGRVTRLIRPVVDAIGWAPEPAEDDLTGKLRGLLVAALGTIGQDTDVVERARTWIDGDDPELVAAATTVVAATGSDAEFDRFVDAYRTAVTPQVERRYLFALAEFPTAEQMSRTVELAFGGGVRTQDAPFLLNRVIASRDNGAVAWSAVRQRWTEATTRFPSNTIGRMVESVKLLTDATVVADVQSFFAEHPIPQAAKSLEQTLERQRVNAALFAREHARLGDQL